jgi:hypothetical protein
MLYEVVDFLLLIRSKFYPAMFRHMIDILRGRECLISHQSGVLCNGRVRIVTRRLWHVIIIMKLKVK